MSKGNQIFAFFGTDEARVKEQALRLAREWTPPDNAEFGLEIVSGNAETSDHAASIVGETIAALETLPFFGGDKTVWLQGVNFLADNVTGRAAATRATATTVRRHRAAVGPGRLVALTAGWHPADSQLALSSKFVPLIYGLLERSAGARPDRPRRHVGEPIPLNESPGTSDRIVEGPGERRWVLPARSVEFIHTETPGLYRLRDEHGRRTWAVNVNPAEGRTAPLPLETLEAHGPRVNDPDKPQAAEAAPNARRRTALESETNQRLWRWAVLVALGVLMVETWLAGRPLHTAPREEAP